MEFALVAPVFLLLVLSVFEFSVGYFILAAMERSILESSRFGSLGQGTVEARVARIRGIVEEASFGFLSDDEVTVTVRHFPDFAALADAGPDPVGADGPGAPEEVALFRVEYTWEPITPFFAPLGSIPVIKQIAVQNEPE